MRVVDEPWSYATMVALKAALHLSRPRRRLYVVMLVQAYIAVKFPDLVGRLSDFENFSRSLKLNVKSPDFYSAVKSPER